MKVFPEIDERMASWIRKQQMFFVGTAPLSGDGFVNLSPKGVDGTFFPSAHSEFDLRDGERYHVPLLVTPFGHSTYRGD